jgi:hypothetical protein
MKNFLTLTSLSALALVASAASAATYSVDYTSVAPGTVVTSGPDLAWSLAGGPGADTAPTISDFGGYPYGISNSSYGGSYPTAEDLIATFSTPMSGISFTFDSFGYNSYDYAYVYSGATLVDQVFIGDSSQTPYSLADSGVTSIVFDNFYGAYGYSWSQQVETMSYSPSSAPGPLGIIPFAAGLIGVAVRRRKTC